ncbi:MAG: hypothetical protein B1H07_00215 [Campylobacteraceae bacterium 4484_166]|nr:MAG: hypothetical protein B1H07_00215 [Campylobacteraceae bacterium 4484_166]
MKKDDIVITFSNIGQSKSYNLSSFIQKFIEYFAIFIVFVLSISFVFLTYLNNKVDKLVLLNQEQTIKIAKKKKEFDKLDDNLEELKTIVGINTDDMQEIIKKATLDNLSRTQKLQMLRIVPSGNPVKKINISSPFGWRVHPVKKTKTFHKGIDLAIARGSKLFATADGVVKYVQNQNKGSYGRRVILAHNYGFETAFGHLKSVTVNVGDFIQKGQLIGYTGNSGRSTGPHVHYEVLHAKKVLNPYNFMNWSIKNYEMLFTQERKVNWDSLVQTLARQNKMATMIEKSGAIKKEQQGEENVQ